MARPSDILSSVSAALMLPANSLGAEEPPSFRPLKILMITQWFDPEPTFKGLLFAKELRRLGHKVQVLTGFPNYPGGKVYSGYKIRLFQREVMEGIQILRVPLYPSHDGSGLRRALNYISFAATASIGALIMKRPDVAYVYHPPATVGIPAIVLKVAKGVPFVYDVQDLWPDTLAATGMIERASALSAVGKFMQSIYRAASRVVVLSSGFRTALLDRSIPAERIEVISNWADEDQIELRRPTRERARQLGFGDQFTVTFAGNMGKGQALETVLHAARLLGDDNRVRFLLVGGGVETEALRRQASDMKLSNVTFLPRRPISEIGEILTLSDALLVHLDDSALFEITIPSKTQAYLMAGRPILMGVRGDAARMVHEASAGLSFEPKNPDELAKAVRGLMALGQSERDSMGTAGRSYYDEHLALAVGASRFSNVLQVASYSKPFVAATKRIADILVSAAALVVLCVPIAAIALGVRRKLGSPVIFAQERPGRDDVPFRIYKFRTMTDATDSDGKALPDSLRLTPFGSMLRATSLDELPELVNVLKGDMSIVGPRPLLTRYTEYFTDEEKLRFLVRPGITGAAQVSGRNTASWDARLALDVKYVKTGTLITDLKILARTVLQVLRASGVVVDPESTMKNLDDERRGGEIQWQ